MQCYTIPITSSSAGAFTGTIGPMFGFIAGIFIENGTATPSASWDMTLKEVGTDRQIWTNTAISESADTEVCPVYDRDAGGGKLVDTAGVAVSNDVGFKAVPIAGHVSVVCANMGDAKTAKLTIYVDDR